MIGVVVEEAARVVGKELKALLELGLARFGIAESAEDEDEEALPSPRIQ